MKIASRLLAIAVAALLLFGVSTSAASAVSPTTSGSAATNTVVLQDGDGAFHLVTKTLPGSGHVQPMAHYTCGWVSCTVYFNKTETKIIALGGTIASWIPNPAAVIGGRAIMVWAAIAVATNRCVKFKVYAWSVLFPQLSSPGYYSGSSGNGYCR